MAALNRAGLIRRAFHLEWLTVGWLVVEAAVAIGSGLAAGSLSLVAFGADSVIELASAGVLLWRLRVELLHGEEFSKAIER
ncbi:MAG: cobalt transporter, partial [Alphaproteobacteria bacterium]|nr:cobalt transporter [Alphaproteobacteria bacterium]